VAGVSHSGEAKLLLNAMDVLFTLLYIVAMEGKQEIVCGLSNGTIVNALE